MSNRKIGDPIIETICDSDDENEVESSLPKNDSLTSIDPLNTLVPNNKKTYGISASLDEVEAVSDSMIEDSFPIDSISLPNLPLHTSPAHSRGSILTRATLPSFSSRKTESSCTFPVSVPLSLPPNVMEDDEEEETSVFSSGVPMSQIDSTFSPFRNESLLKHIAEAEHISPSKFLTQLCDTPESQTSTQKLSYSKEEILSSSSFKPPTLLSQKSPEFKIPTTPHNLLSANVKNDSAAKNTSPDFCSQLSLEENSQAIDILSPSFISPTQPVSKSKLEFSTPLSLEKLERLNFDKDKTSKVSNFPSDSFPHSSRETLTQGSLTSSQDLKLVLEDSQSNAISNSQLVSKDVFQQKKIVDEIETTEYSQYTLSASEIEKLCHPAIHSEQPNINPLLNFPIQTDYVSPSHFKREKTVRRVDSTINISSDSDVISGGDASLIVHAGLEKSNHEVFSLDLSSQSESESENILNSAQNTHFKESPSASVVFPLFDTPTTSQLTQSQKSERSLYEMVLKTNQNQPVNNKKEKLNSSCGLKNSIDNVSGRNHDKDVEGKSSSENSPYMIDPTKLQKLTPITTSTTTSAEISSPSVTFSSPVMSEINKNTKYAENIQHCEEKILKDVSSKIAKNSSECSRSYHTAVLAFDSDDDILRSKSNEERKTIEKLSSTRYSSDKSISTFSPSEISKGSHTSTSDDKTAVNTFVDGEKKSKSTSHKTEPKKDGAKNTTAAIVKSSADANENVSNKARTESGSGGSMLSTELNSPEYLTNTSDLSRIGLLRNVDFDILKETRTNKMFAVITNSEEKNRVMLKDLGLELLTLLPNKDNKFLPDLSTISHGSAYDRSLFSNHTNTNFPLSSTRLSVASVRSLDISPPSMINQSSVVSMRENSAINQNSSVSVKNKDSSTESTFFKPKSTNRNNVVSVADSSNQAMIPPQPPKPICSSTSDEIQVKETVRRKKPTKKKIKIEDENKLDSIVKRVNTGDGKDIEGNNLKSKGQNTEKEMVKIDKKVQKEATKSTEKTPKLAKLPDKSNEDKSQETGNESGINDTSSFSVLCKTLGDDLKKQLKEAHVPLTDDEIEMFSDRKLKFDKEAIANQYSSIVRKLRNVKIQPNTLAFAKYTLDKRYYSAVVKSKQRHDKWKVNFLLDGCVSDVRDIFIIPLELLPRGTHCDAHQPDSDFSDPGIVIGHFTRDDMVVHVVELLDGNVVERPHSHLSLSNSVANELLEHKNTFQSLTTSPGITWDNIIQKGKRGTAANSAEQEKAPDSTLVSIKTEFSPRKTRTPASGSKRKASAQDSISVSDNSEFGSCDYDAPKSEGTSKRKAAAKTPKSSRKKKSKLTFSSELYTTANEDQEDILKPVQKESSNESDKNRPYASPSRPDSRDDKSVASPSRLDSADQPTASPKSEQSGRSTPPVLYPRVELIQLPEVSTSPVKKRGRPGGSKSSKKKTKKALKLETNDLFSGEKKTQRIENKDSTSGTETDEGSIDLIRPVSSEPSGLGRQIEKKESVVSCLDSIPEDSEIPVVDSSRPEAPNRLPKYTSENKDFDIKSESDEKNDVCDSQFETEKELRDADLKATDPMISRVHDVKGSGEVDFEDNGGSKRGIFSGYAILVTCAPPKPNCAPEMDRFDMMQKFVSAGGKVVETFAETYSHWINSRPDSDSLTRPKISDRPALLQHFKEIYGNEAVNVKKKAKNKKAISSESTKSTPSKNTEIFDFKEMSRLKSALPTLPYTAFCITDTYSKTEKFIESLACGIPILSYHWVYDCIKQGEFLNWYEYLVPAGVCLVDNREVQQRIPKVKSFGVSRRRDLKNLDLDKCDLKNKRHVDVSEISSVYSPALSKTQNIKPLSVSKSTNGGESQSKLVNNEQSRLCNIVNNEVEKTLVNIENKSKLVNTVNIDESNRVNTVNNDYTSKFCDDLQVQDNVSTSDISSNPNEVFRKEGDAHSTQNQELLNWDQCHRIFRNDKVYIGASKSGDLWAEILLALGAKVVRKPTRGGNIHKLLDKRVTFLMTDSSTTAEEVVKAQTYNIPLRTFDWLIGSLIAGYKIPTTV